MHALACIICVIFVCVRDHPLAIHSPLRRPYLNKALSGIPMPTRGIPCGRYKLLMKFNGLLFFQLRDAIGDFLRASSAENPSLPATTQELEKTPGVRLVVHRFNNVLALIIAAAVFLVCVSS